MVQVIVLTCNLCGNFLSDCPQINFISDLGLLHLLSVIDESCTIIAIPHLAVRSL
jgi:hypothetical protein